MWPDGYYYQRQDFYNYRWTKEMEQTFVDSLLEHRRHGQFEVDRDNRHAVHCSLRTVNRRHGSKVSAQWAFSRVKRLRERFEVFDWLISRPDVVWNRNLKFVTAVDSVWEEICREKNLARCYINAYEDLFEDLAVLFGVPVPNEQVLIAPAALPPPPEPEQVVSPVEVEVEVVPVDLHAENPIQMPVNVVNIISDSSELYNVVNKLH